MFYGIVCIGMAGLASLMGGLLQVTLSIRDRHYILCIWHIRCCVIHLCFPLQTTISVLGALGGPLLGLFSLGILFPSANSNVSTMISAFNLHLDVQHMNQYDTIRMCKNILTLTLTLVLPNLTAMSRRNHGQKTPH